MLDNLSERKVKKYLMKKIDIFQYRDLTCYLKAVYKNRYERAVFSYRTIAVETGIGLNMLHHIFSGTQNITPRYYQSFVDLLQLKGKEKRFFELLVHVSQSEMPDKLKRKIFRQFDRTNI